MNIVIPMAGRGGRFLKNNQEIPKPLMPISGKSMIEHAIESLNLKGKYIFITRKYTKDYFNQKLNGILNKLTKNPIIIDIDYTTEGPASSALLAKDYINNDEDLVITNCDQILFWDSNSFLKQVTNSDLDGIVVTYNTQTEKNSYIQLDENGYGCMLSEKKVISNYSLNGVHYWKKGQYFIKSAEEMVRKSIRVNNEFYISLTYNEMILSGQKVGIYHLPDAQHFAVGTPEDIQTYLERR